MAVARVLAFQNELKDNPIFRRQRTRETTTTTSYGSATSSVASDDPLADVDDDDVGGGMPAHKSPHDSSPSSSGVTSASVMSSSVTSSSHHFHRQQFHQYQRSSSVGHGHQAAAALITAEFRKVCMIIFFFQFWGIWRYTPITYYWTGLLIFDHSYFLGNLTNSKIAERKALEPLKS
jgi:hypothetical protein